MRFAEKQNLVAARVAFEYVGEQISLERRIVAVKIFRDFLFFERRLVANFERQVVANRLPTQTDVKFAEFFERQIEQIPLEKLGRGIDVKS